MNPKKIILVSRCAWTLYNFRAGLLRALLTEGYEVKGAGAGGDGFESRIKAFGVPFEVLPVDKKGINPTADFRLLYTLYRWYRREKPDVVHHFTIKPVIYGSMAARLAKVPRVVNTITGLGYVFTNANAGRLRLLVEKLYQVALKCADYTFFQNHDDLAHFRKRKILDGRNAEVLPGSGVDCGFFAPASNAGSNGDGTTFLMVSRLLKDKGVYEYAEAAERVKSRYPGTRFLLLGRRDTRNPSVIPQRLLEQWQLSGNVHYLGEVPDVRSILRDTDVVVLPSYREGIPRALLEAAAMSKPVITTDAIGCREVVDHEVTGVLVPIRDSAALAEAMARMIEYPDLRRQMGVRGREKMLREFDEGKVIRQTMAQY